MLDNDACNEKLKQHIGTEVIVWWGVCMCANYFILQVRDDLTDDVTLEKSQKSDGESHTNFWWGKRKKTLEIKGSNCKGPVAGYVFGVSVAGMDELEEDSRAGEGHVVLQLAGHYGEPGFHPD